MAERCAVIGVGQTVAKSKREDVSIAGLVREAALAALEDAGLGVRRHRRRGHRQGARHVRGRHDARALPRAGARRRGQADVPRPHGGLGGRVDGHRGVAPRGVGCARARAHRGLREAERLGRHVGALGAPALLGAAAGRGRRVLRPDHPGLHVPLGRAARHRHDGGGQGPAARAEEPLRAPPPARHLHEDGGGVDHAVGPAALPRVVPVLGRRCRDGHRVGEGGGCGHGGDRVGRRRGSTAWPCARSRRCSPAGTRSTRRPGRDCAADLYRQAGITNPRAGLRHGRGLRALQLVRADVAGEPRLLRRGRRAGSSPRPGRRR